MDNKEVKQLDDADVVEIKKSYFFDGLSCPVAVYLRLSKGHYLLIGKPNEKTQFSSLSSYQNPISQVFVEKKDYDSFIKFITHLTEQMVDKPALPQVAKAKYIQGLSDHLMGLLEKKNFSNEQQLGRVSNLILKFSQSVSGFEEVEKILSQLDNDDSKHAMSTCMVAILIAEEMEITQAQVFEKLAMAALLHDIGLKYIPNDFLKKPRHEWTSDELTLYESHPIKGVEALRDIKDVTQDVLLMVSEHHENALGTGFPKKIRDVKISPLGRILIVANYFTDLLFSRVEGAKSYDAPAAIEFMEEVLGQPFNKQVFRCLKNIIIMDEMKRKMRVRG